MKKARVQFISHSGVLVEADGCALLFDYFQGDFPSEKFEEAGHRIVLTSHAHRDHYTPRLFKLAPEGTQFILSSDIGEKRGYLMSPGNTLELDGVTVKAFGSTDQGVSFLVETDGLTVFHSGDLNLWSWRDESTEEEIQQAVSDFEAILETIGSPKIDIAFFPYDKRMGTAFDEGMKHFCARFKPAYVMPIHFWDHFEEAADFVTGDPEIKALIPTENGQTFRLEF